MVKLFAATVLIAVALAILLPARRPAPLLIQASATAAPQMLFAPCPLGPRNLPPRPSKREA